MSALFNAGMAGNSPDHARVVAARYDFSGMKMVVDVGGGRGRLLSTILAQDKQLSGILFDQPHVLDDARPVVAEAGVADRCTFVGGNFFEVVPTGGDAYILRNIIHDWQDAQAVSILATCRRAMADGARLLLVERFIAEDPRDALPVLHADLEMLVNVGGRERTTEEYAALFARSGLSLIRTISKETMWSFMWRPRSMAIGTPHDGPAASGVPHGARRGLGAEERAPEVHVEHPVRCAGSSRRSGSPPSRRRGGPPPPPDPRARPVVGRWRQCDSGVKTSALTGGGPRRRFRSRTGVAAPRSTYPIPVGIGWDGSQKARMW